MFIPEKEYTKIKAVLLILFVTNLIVHEKNEN